jgi:phosphate:Na+ symporter
VLVGNLAFRAVGAVAVLIALDWLAPLVAAIEAAPARQIANAHTLFNVAVAAVGLPLIWPFARLLERWFPDAEPVGERRLAHLDESLIDRPQIALGQASREVMRLADMVEIMLRETILAFDERDEARRKQVKSLDEGVDRLQEEIKLYLTRLTREKLSEDEGRRAFDLILFTTNLEHIGDIIDRNLLELAAKKNRLQLGFSPEGWSEIQAFHARVVEQMRRAVTVFVTRDPAMARELVEEKDRLRLAEREAMQTHLDRLRAGKVASIETSSLHLDILRDLKRINSHITSVALPILEANGELRGSRLRPALAQAS